MVRKVDYGGWENCIEISNDNLELIVTTDVGPRIISCKPKDGPELFKQFEDQLGGTGETEWKSRGGHRLWHAPESMPRTYAIDNKPVMARIIDDNAAEFLSDFEKESGLQKIIRIDLDKNRVFVAHTIINLNPWPVTFAPWALTVMTPGGIAVIPLPEKRPHPEALAPDFPVVMWPYVKMNDPRFYWGERFITLQQNVSLGPTKIGLPCIEEWAAYLFNGYTFIKYFGLDEELVYPDFGCNLETFTNEEILEIESLGPLETVDPGKHFGHIEQWAVAPIDQFDPMSINEDYLEKYLVPLVNKYR